MSNSPQFKYFLSCTKNRLQRGSRIWTSPVPTGRRWPQGAGGDFVSYGDYFCAARSFLEKNRFEIITFAISQHTDLDIAPEEIKEVNIYLEKHGEFYHPARIEAVARSLSFKFVLNVAVSDIGKGCIKREYNLLKRLNSGLPFSFLPKVYGHGEVCVDGSRVKVSMFLGEWLEGFNEFHISKDQADGKKRIAVWGSGQREFFLSPKATAELYRQAAMILTCYYNVETFEQIFPWHHAAGDFVIKLQNSSVKLKLTTARQYASLIEKRDGDADSILEAMLIFILNLSIRTRLDRLNGVGAIVWSDDIAVEETLKGFLEGLDNKPPIGSSSDSIAARFQNYLLSCTETDLYDLSRVIVDACNPLAPEIPVIKQNLKRHTEVFLKALQNFCQH